MFRGLGLPDFAYARVTRCMRIYIILVMRTVSCCSLRHFDYAVALANAAEGVQARALVYDVVAAELVLGPAGLAGFKRLEHLGARHEALCVRLPVLVRVLGCVDATLDDPLAGFVGGCSGGAVHDARPVRCVMLMIPEELRRRVCPARGG